MDELPKIYVNPISDDLNNYQDRAIIDNEERIDFNKIITDDIYSFNHHYWILLNDNKDITTSIIKVSNNKILTIDNGWIDINNIKSIKEIKK